MQHPGTRSIVAAVLGLGLWAGMPGPALGAEKGPLKVFILSGQSNMEGKAAAYTLDAVLGDPAQAKPFRHLKKNGEWVERDDVWVTFLDRRGKGGFPTHGPLTVGYGSEKMVRDADNRRIPHPGVGPELGIGHVLGDHLDEQVLLIKAAWGGRALRYTFRPPSAIPGDAEIQAEVDAINARREEATRKAKENPNPRKKPKPVAPPRTFEEHRAGYGSDYRRVLSETRKVLDDIRMYFPDHDPDEGVEIAGFIWFQGWNDAIGNGNPDYVEQMAHFIRDMRRDLEAPDLPFVIGELGTDGPDAQGWIARFRKQQEEIAALEEWKGTVQLARTAEFWPRRNVEMKDRWDAFREAARTNSEKPGSDPTRVDPGEFYNTNWAQKYRRELSFTSDKRYHYLGSGACYYRMGEAMGKGMVELLKRRRAEAVPRESIAEETVPPAHASPAPYSTDSWNRLHRLLFARTDGDGRIHVHSTDPLLYRGGSFLLEGDRHGRVLAALDELLAAPAERLTDATQLERLLFQHDLWAAFDHLAWYPDEWVHRSRHERSARILRTRIARIVGRLGLEERELRELPDNYALAIESGPFSATHESGHPERPFLPPDLFDPTGPWVRFHDRGIDPLTRRHFEGAGGRSVHFVFLRLPEGREATRRYLGELARDSIRQFPEGTMVAMVRRALTVDRSAKVRLTPITELVQVRVYRRISDNPEANLQGDLGEQDVYEFLLDRHALFGGEHGLVAVGPREPATSFSRGEGDPFDAEPRRSIVARKETQLSSCIQCHQAPGVHSVLSMQRGLKQTGRDNFATLDSRVEANYTVRAKVQRFDWGLLQGLLEAD